ncbi:MAG: cytochrome c3 family protein [Deltaproteobacteria bacterium]|nr:cytochrome c3 family protein [Deltaproteobacteria bacterium]
MKLSRRYWIMVAASVAIVACATVKVKHSLQLSSVLKFSHAFHVEQGDCGDCHGEIAKSTGPTLGKFIPKKNHGGCADCHEDATTDKKECKLCHVGTDKNIELTRVNRQLIFSHKSHEPHLKDKGGCKHCHAAAYTAKKAGTKLLGKMAVCTDSCHKSDLNSQACDKCHTNLRGQTLQAVASLGHQGDFLKRHGPLARNTQRCAQCHDQTFCGDCHAKTAAMPLSLRYPERVNARYIHRGDYLGRHSRDARARPDTCRKCHGAKHCTTCHEMQGVSAPVGKARLGTNLRKVHGGQWMQPGQPGFHGRLARRDSSRCASCHDQGAASNCVRCHQVGGSGGNPHTPGFKWRNKADECRKNPMCLSCHVGGMGCR